jgi:MoaA/NifB/PqqE/SkfB family radical SAM enzyme
MDVNTQTSEPGALAPPEATSDPSVVFGPGFYDREDDGHLDFHWMGSTGRLEFAPADVERFLDLQVYSEFLDFSQEATCASGGREERFPLRAGWAPMSLVVPAGADRVDLGVNKLFPPAYYPGDGRSLAIRVRAPEFHRDATRHRNIVLQQSNLAKNEREMLAGRATLESTPPRLGIDLYGVCNVKPPCVYCEWDHNKKLEGDDVDTPFTLDTLNEWGPFFDNSMSLVNCSIGEPFMMRNLDELLDAFGSGGKEVEITTNGQILTDRNIQRLIGRPVNLYVSLDAGTPETYAKLRNNRFDAILKNLDRLITAKGGPGRYPHIHLVFMPMKVNVHELSRFVEIAARLRVDLLVLRPLNYSEGVTLDWERSGYRFEYQKELLPFDELVRVSGRAAELCLRAGVPLADQMDFGGSMGAQFEQWFEEGRQSVRAASEPGPTPTPARDRLPEAPAPAAVAPAPVGAASVEPLPSLGSDAKPACTEPWKSLYILRRGVFPCCYGGQPVAPMDGYREAWNSPLLQAIRADLAQGRFHEYCMGSPACPIVRKSAAAHELPAAQSGRLVARRLRRRLADAWRRVRGTQARR